MNTPKLAFKVGIFVFLGILALGYLTIEVTKYKKLLFMKGYELEAVFDNVAGLKPNNAVLMAGVDIGRVKDISLTADGRAKVVLLIKPKVKITADAQALIRGYGVVGTKYVEIKQGNSPKFLKPQQMIAHTQSTTSVDETISKVTPLLDKLQTTIDNINDYLTSEKHNLKELTENLKKASQNVAEISAKINQGQGTLGRLINQDTLYKNLNTAANRLNNLISKVEQGQGTLGKLVNDDSLYLEAKNTIDDLHHIITDIKQGKGTIGKLVTEDTLYNKANDIMNQVDQMVSDLNNGKGTLGKLLKDDKLYEDARETLRNIRETSTAVRESTPLSVIGTAVGVAK